MDTLFYEAQRQVCWVVMCMFPCHSNIELGCISCQQGRFSFYLTSQGEEATTVASAAALQAEDTVRPMY